MKHLKLWLWLSAILNVALLSYVYVEKKSNAPSREQAEINANPALSVAVTTLEEQQIPVKISANGSIAAWQDAIIGAEIGGLRIQSLPVQVGQAVKKGQLLATFDDSAVLADLAQSQANLAEAEASLAEAKITARRAREIATSGALSQQQIDQYQTSEKTAQAKLAAAIAQLSNQQLRLRHTKVIAVDDGVISSRTTTLGAVAAEGQELFRLIRQNRLEWRGEVTASQLIKLQPKLKATIKIPDVGETLGEIRVLAPTLDGQNRNALVYVDLPNAQAQGFRPGMYGKGDFNLGSQTAWTISQDAVIRREGFSFVFKIVENNQEIAKVALMKVELGALIGNRFELISGLKPGDKLVAGGGVFLADGDTVRLVKP